MEDDHPVFRSLDIIERRITEKLTVEHIAGSVFFSKYHYGRLFRELVGDSVMEYVTKRKLSLAGQALLQTDAAVVDVALAFGYESREGFTRSFKAYMGVTPTEYCKYHLTAISHTIVKERYMMMYSKTTDEILRALNHFIAKARELAVYARKCELSSYATFWDETAGFTDQLADKLEKVLRRITVIAEHPDEITQRLTILNTVEKITFETQVLAFHTGLTVARAKPEDSQAMQPLCEKYADLAHASALTTHKIANFLHELALFIFDDMRKTAADKIDQVIQAGKAAADGITGYSYIKDEIVALVNAINAIPMEDMSLTHLENSLFRLQILSFAVATDVLRSGGAYKVMFDGLGLFKERLEESVDFFHTLPKSEAYPAAVPEFRKQLTEIAFQGNILLFYTRGEASDEKLGIYISPAQKSVFAAIGEKINEMIMYAHNATDENAYSEIIDRLREIQTAMDDEADDLKEKGGAVRFLANEFKRLADSVEEMQKRYVF